MSAEVDRMRQALKSANRYLREAEDIARIELPAQETADRIRSIHEQVSDDLLNGKITVPPLKAQLFTATAALERIRSGHSNEAVAIAHDALLVIRGRMRGKASDR